MSFEIAPAEATFTQYGGIFYINNTMELSGRFHWSVFRLYQISKAVGSFCRKGAKKMTTFYQIFSKWKTWHKLSFRVNLFSGLLIGWDCWSGGISDSLRSWNIIQREIWSRGSESRKQARKPCLKSQWAKDSLPIAFILLITCYPCTKL